jgi:hypothetical protein
VHGLQQLLLGSDQLGAVNLHHRLAGTHFDAGRVDVQPLQPAGRPGGDGAQAGLVGLDPPEQLQWRLHGTALHRPDLDLHQRRGAWRDAEPGQRHIAVIVLVRGHRDQVHAADRALVVGVGGAHLRVHRAGVEDLPFRTVPGGCTGMPAMVV